MSLDLILAQDLTPWSAIVLIADHASTKDANAPPSAAIANMSITKHLLDYTIPENSSQPL